MELFNLLLLASDEALNYTHRFHRKEVLFYNFGLISVGHMHKNSMKRCSKKFLQANIIIQVKKKFNHCFLFPPTSFYNTLDTLPLKRVFIRLNGSIIK
uniref:Uncharacterized protein n=1 Tax=Lepeophtheirus salmonis TaxID=72036 RepID=A0A0K2ULP3_LEPSM